MNDDGTNRPPRRALPVLPPAARRDPVGPAYVALRDGLRHFIRRRVAEDHVDDLVQEVFLRMQEHADALRDEERLAAWAYRIARNVIVDHHRRDHARVAREEVAVEADERDANVNEIVAGWLRPMLALLPDEYAEALELVELEGLTQKELAERAGISLSGAKSRVQRARQMLEGVVRACCDLEQDVRGNVIGFTRRADGGDESSGNGET
jgi:RNA polymerase sigma-70 factor (ECF subfamily)